MAKAKGNQGKVTFINLLRRMVQETRVGMRAKERVKAPVVVQRVLNAYYDEIIEHNYLLRSLVADAINAVVREILKHESGDHGTEDERQQQLADWPKGMRKMVEAVGLVAVYVPSTDGHIELRYGEITATQVFESADYYEKESATLAERSRRLRTLGRAMGRDEKKASA